MVYFRLLNFNKAKKLACNYLRKGVSLDPAKLEHEAARNDVSKPSEDLCMEIVPVCSGASEFQGNALRDCRW
jgi:hypothetical protein